MHPTYNPGTTARTAAQSKKSTPPSWILAVLMVAMLLLSTSASRAVTYFSVGTGGDPTTLTVWTNTAGANPANFTSGDTFIILSGANLTIGAGETWAVNATSAGTAGTVQVNSGG